MKSARRAILIIAILFSSSLVLGALFPVSFSLPKVSAASTTLSGSSGCGQLTGSWDGSTCTISPASCLCSGEIDIGVVPTSNLQYGEVTIASGFNVLLINGAFIAVKAGSTLTNDGTISSDGSSTADSGTGSSLGIAITQGSTFQNYNTVESGLWADGSSTLENLGTITLSNNEQLINNGSTIINSGTINLEGNAAIGDSSAISNCGTLDFSQCLTLSEFENSATGKINAEGSQTEIYNQNYFVNYGTIVVSGSLYNSWEFVQSGAYVFPGVCLCEGGQNIFGEIVNVNSGVIDIAQGTGVLTNNIGEIINNGTINDYNVILNENEGNITNSQGGTIYNGPSANFENAYNLFNEAGATVQNDGILSNDPNYNSYTVCYNYDSFTGQCSANIVIGAALGFGSSGTFVNNGQFYNYAGFLGISGTFANSGQVNNDGVSGNNPSGGVVLSAPTSNSGTINDAAGFSLELISTLTNTGTINNQGSLSITNINFNSGLLVNYGTVSTTGSGSITGFDSSILNYCSGSVTGNQPSAGAIRNIPCAPVLTTPSGQLTISGSVTVSGTENLASNSGYPVTIYIGQGCFLCNDYIASTSTDSTGAWSVSVPLSAGAYTLYAQASPDSSFASEYDSGSSNTITVTVDHSLDQTTCQSIIGGTWSSNTCYNAGTFTIQPTDSLQVGSGVTLENYQTSEIINHGELSISGTLVNSAGDQLLNFGTLTNTGTIDNSGSVVNELGGSVSDSGTIDTGAGVITNDGVFTVNLDSATCQSYPLMGSWNPGYISTCTVPSGTIVTIESGVTLNVPVGDALTNSGSISNSGTIDLSMASFFNNVCPGTITGNPVTGSGTIQFTPCAPVITTTSGGVYLGTLSISGTSDLASNGGNPMTITLYSGSNTIGSETTSSDGSWTIVTNSQPGFLTIYATATSSENIASAQSNQITLTYQYLDQASCISPIEGTWDPASSICTVSGSYLLPTADGLQIPTGTTLSVSESGAFTNNGTMSDLGVVLNAGTFTNQIVLAGNEPSGGALTLSGEFTSSGTFWNDGLLTINSGGTFTNSGQMTDAQIPSTHVSSGGRLQVNSGGAFNNDAGATMSNQQDASVQTQGAFNNGGTITSAEFSYFENDGTFSNSGTITIDSAQFQQGGGTLTNTGTINVVFTQDELPELSVSSGSFNNYGTINLQGFGISDLQDAMVVNEIGGTIDNQFALIVDYGLHGTGSVVNYGAIINEESPSAISNGASQFSGSFRVYDTFTNYGTFTNDFITTINGATFDNYGAIVNSALNSGNLTNSGTLNEYCGSSITGAAVLGTSPVTNSEIACPVSILPIQTIATMTDSSTITASGSAQPGVTVNLYLLVSGDLQSEGTVTADSTGSWSITTVSLPLGSYTFAADATNSFGTSGLSNFVTAEIINLVCSAGSYASDGVCVPAPAGYYVPTSGAVSPTPCAVGTYQPDTGQSSCLQAPAGSYVDNTAAISATQCPPGTFTSLPGQLECTNAPAGSYASGPGATSATLCPAGTYSSSTGSASCILAPAGSYVPESGETSPTFCQSGTFSSTQGATSCTPAMLGYYVPLPDSTSELACLTGTFTSLQGQQTCTDAPAGTFVPTSGASFPTPCPGGEYQPNTGQAACLEAPPGSFVSPPTSGATVGAIAPTLCSPGAYQPNSGQTSCLSADPGYFVSTFGAVQEEQCPQYHTSEAGASSCYLIQVSVTLNLTPASSSASISPNNYFVLSFTSGGNMQTLQVTSSTTSFVSDAGTHFTVSPLSSATNASERWCITISSGTCIETSFQTGGGPSLSVALTYYQQLLLSVSTSPSNLSPVPAILPSSSSGFYNAGTSVTLTANTVSSYMFILWQVDGTNGTDLATSITVTMNQTHSLVAYYEQPANAVQSLISVINTSSIQHGTQTSLDAKLNAALNSLSNGNSDAAVNQLNAFIKEVNAQSGKHISPTDAALLVPYAQEIINTING